MLQVPSWDKVILTATLPNRMWKLIDLALADLRKVENDPRYFVAMEYWHRPPAPWDSIFNPDMDDPHPMQACRVCLAGAILAKTIRVPVTQLCKPDNFPDDIRGKLLALNFAQRGMQQLACETFYYDEPENLYRVKKNVSFYRSIASYRRDSEEFHVDMGRMARYLEARGV